MSLVKASSAILDPLREGSIPFSKHLLLGCGAGNHHVIWVVFPNMYMSLISKVQYHLQTSSSLASLESDFLTMY